MKLWQIILPILLLGLYSVKFAKAQNTTTPTPPTSLTTPTSPTGGSSKRVIVSNLHYTAVRRIRVDGGDNAGTNVNGRNRRRGGRRTRRNRGRGRNGRRNRRNG